jgi:hypothetical protein
MVHVSTGKNIEEQIIAENKSGFEITSEDIKTSESFFSMEVEQHCAPSSCALIPTSRRLWTNT